MAAGYQLNLSRTFSYICNRELVALYDATGSAISVAQDAKRLPQGLAERAPSDGNYLMTRIDWRLPATQVSGEISPGWFVRDASDLAYVVLSADGPSTYQADWRLKCIALMVMGDAIDWYQVDQATDDYADRVTDPTTFPVGGHYICRIQPITISETDILAKRGFTQLFMVYLLSEPDINYGDLFVDQNATKYKVVSWRSKQNLDSALEVTVEIQP